MSGCMGYFVDKQRKIRNKFLLRDRHHARAPLLRAFVPDIGEKLGFHERARVCFTSWMRVAATSVFEENRARLLAE